MDTDLRIVEIRRLLNESRYSEARSLICCAITREYVQNSKEYINEEEGEAELFNFKEHVEAKEIAFYEYAYDHGNGNGEDEHVVYGERKLWIEDDEQWGDGYGDGYGAGGGDGFCNRSVFGNGYSY